jgi:acyl carrier protein
MTPTTDQVLAELSAMIRDVVGEEWVGDAPITLETSFNDDLELESIELVALAERLSAAYGEKVNFATWIADKELGEILALKVGDVVAYLERCLSPR